MTVSSMEFEVLRSVEEIEAAREVLQGRGLWSPPSPRRRGQGALKRMLGRQDLVELARPDPMKSWDVLRTIEAIEGTLKPDDPVLDVGSFASAIPPALAQLGFTQLKGIDLDPRVEELSTDGIEYVVGDLTSTGWADGSFQAVTAISVIEHGVRWGPLFAELSRLLRPGGVFLFSTDYWPEKLDTSDKPLFGLPWTIFSRQEIEAFLEEARGYGLAPMSDLPDELERLDDPPIDFAGRRYTFLHGTVSKPPEADGSSN